MRYVINDVAFDVDPKEWPTGSTFSLMYEGDPYANELRLNNSGMTSESIQLIVDVITKDITRLKLLASDINWNNLMYTIKYLGIGVSVDFIYPLFLTIEDRIEWYRTCETRQTYICGYSEDPEDESKFVFGGVEEKEEELISVHFDDMELRDLDYDMVGENAFPIDKGNELSVGVEDSILEELSHIPNLFVAGGYPLDRFDNKDVQTWHDIDIFAYGDNALEHIKEGVKICIEISNEGKRRLSQYLSRSSLQPVRTLYSISIPIPVTSQHQYHRYGIVIIQFILIKSRSQYQILNRFDIDASCIGFHISNPSRFYALPRFIRAFETKTNIIDPTRQSPTYIKRLIKYAGRGYNIAVPGFDSNNIKLSSKILKFLTESQIQKRDSNIKDMKLIGLQGLVTSSLTRHSISLKQLNVISGGFSDYSYVNVKNIARIIIDMTETDGDGPYLINDGEPINFVVGDVLNEGSRPFEVMLDLDGIIVLIFVPSYPFIELMDDDPQNGMIGSIHQVKTSFYGEYYGAEMETKPLIRSVSPSRRSFRSLRSSTTVSREIQTSPLRKSSIVSRSSKPRSSSIILRPSRIRKSKLRVISKPRLSP